MTVAAVLIVFGFYRCFKSQKSPGNGVQVLKDILLTVRTNMHEIGDIPLLIEMESKQKAHRAGAEDAWDKGRTKKPQPDRYLQEKMSLPQEIVDDITMCH